MASRVVTIQNGLTEFLVDGFISQATEVQSVEVSSFLPELCFTQDLRVELLISHGHNVKIG